MVDSCSGLDRARQGKVQARICIVRAGSQRLSCMAIRQPHHRSSSPISLPASDGRLLTRSGSRAGTRRNEPRIPCSQRLLLAMYGIPGMAAGALHLGPIMHWLAPHPRDAAGDNPRPAGPRQLAHPMIGSAELVGASGRIGSHGYNERRQGRSPSRRSGRLAAPRRSRTAGRR